MHIGTKVVLIARLVLIRVVFTAELHYTIEIESNFVMSNSSLRGVVKASASQPWGRDSSPT